MFRRHAVSLTALFVALAGTSYAAVSLAPNSVGSNQIKNRSVRPVDLAPKARPLGEARLRQVVTEVVTDPSTNLVISVKSEKGDVGERGPQGLAGERGPQGDKGEKGESGTNGQNGANGVKGDKGDQGIPGGANVYGRVAGDGSLGSSSSGLIVTRPSTGVYCLDSVIDPVKVIQVTVESYGMVSRRATAAVAPPAGENCAGKDGLVSMFTDAGSMVDAPFYVVVN